VAGAWSWPLTSI